SGELPAAGLDQPDGALQIGVRDVGEISCRLLIRPKYHGVAGQLAPTVDPAATDAAVPVEQQCGSRDFHSAPPEGRVSVSITRDSSRYAGRRVTLTLTALRF